MSLPESEMKSVGNFRKVPGVRLYRCGSPETASQQDVVNMLQMGISCILDLRLEGESKVNHNIGANELQKNAFHKIYRDADPSEVLSALQTRPKRATADKNGNQIDAKPERKNSATREPRARRVCVNLLSGYEYNRFVVSQMPVTAQLRLPFLLAKDAIFRSATVKEYAKARVINPRGLLGLYKDMVDNCGKNLATALSVLSSPESLNPLVCCSFGKDRTGVVVALTLSVVGKTHAEIADDYTLSQIHMNKLLRDGANMGELFGATEEFAHAPRDIMMTLMTYIDQKYHSVPEYLKGIGFGFDKQQRLRDNLTSGCRY